MLLLKCVKFDTFFIVLLPYYNVKIEAQQQKCSYPAGLQLRVSHVTKKGREWPSKFNFREMRKVSAWEKYRHVNEDILATVAAAKGCQGSKVVKPPQDIPTQLQGTFLCSFQILTRMFALGSEKCLGSTEKLMFRFGFDM